MRYAIPALIAASLLTWVTLLAPAPARAAPAHAAGRSAEATATASSGLVRHALREHRAAARDYRSWLRARSCLGLDGEHRRLPRRPDRLAPVHVWESFLGAVHRDHRFCERHLDRCLTRMRSPGGSSSGTRWLPLARWVGWPQSALPHLAYIIQRESSGRPTAVNPSSGCTGLLQILRSHVSDPWRLTDPEYNLRVGLRLYRQAGWSPWAL